MRNLEMNDPVRRERAKYVQLADLFRQRIAQSEWKVGERLPNVEELSSAHGVSRITVRQAMDILAQERLVSRSRGRGTHVLRRPAMLRMLNLRADWADFMASSHGGRSVVLDDRPALTVPAVGPEEGQLRGKYRYLQVLGHLGDDIPVQVRTLYVRNPIYLRMKSRIAESSMLDLLSEFAAKMTMVNEIAAATPAIARLLKVPVGTPVLRARHVGRDERGFIAFIDFPVLRGDYVKFEIAVGRSSSDPGEG